ncbi:hypothetical protein IKE83_02010 [Candidatus Saccharibacteria bacterium]|nr:hypothetical protein [Candidatus Saccharibacteria bacterium]
MRKVINRKKQVRNNPPKTSWLGDTDLTTISGGGTGTAPERGNENWSLMPTENGLFLVLCNGNRMYGPVSETEARNYITIHAV